MIKDVIFNKRSFSLIELIFAILLISIITTFTFTKVKVSDIDIATQKLLLYLNYTRYIANIDNKFDIDNLSWKMKLWTLKFQRCNKSIGGLYYVIYSDESGGTAHYKKSDCLKEPLNNKYIYSSSSCTNKFDQSKYTLLTKEFHITKVEISCNSSSSLGQISFGYDGKIYSKLSSDINKIIEIIEPCDIKLIDNQNHNKTIRVHPKTGFIEML